MAKELVHPSQQVPDRLVHQQRKARLKELEAIILRNIPSLEEVARALLEITETKLYLEEFDNFGDYIKARFPFSRATAYRMIEHVKPPEVSAVVLNETTGEYEQVILARPNGEKRKEQVATRYDENAPKDSAGADIPKNLRAAFTEWQGLYDHYAVLRDQVLRGYSRTRLTSVLRYFPVINTQRILQGRDETEKWLDDICDHLQAGRPWAVHHPCQGKGCRVCVMRGYLTRAEHANAKAIPG